MSEVPRDVLDVLAALASAAAGRRTDVDLVVYRLVGGELVQDAAGALSLPSDPAALAECAAGFARSAAGLRLGMRRWWAAGAAFESVVREAAALSVPGEPSAELAAVLEVDPPAAPARPEPSAELAAVLEAGPARPPPDDAVGEAGARVATRLPAHARYLLARFIDLMAPSVGAPGWCACMRDAALRGDAESAEALWRGLGRDAIMPTLDGAMADVVAAASANVAALYRPRRAPRASVVLAADAGWRARFR